MDDRWSRRDVLRMTGAAMAGLGADDGPPSDAGCVAGHPEGARAGMEVLAAGGNAVDAVVAAALVAGVVALPMCGIAGYGGHLTIAPAGTGRRPVSIDFNTAAPRAARPDLFPINADGRVAGDVNAHGWRAAGVPGTLAGMQLALDRHGSWPFERVVQPALRYARDGFDVTPTLAAAARAARAGLARDRATARLLLPDGQPLRAGSRFRNPDLAAMLETLARRNSADSFYRGDIAARIADAFRRHGGLVTADDLGRYHAREVEPLRLSWCGHDIYTAPLTAGGLSILQALTTLRALEWERRDPNDPRTLQRRVEALRIAWHDRLRLLGDPAQVEVPVGRLLSEDYARQSAARVEEAVRRGRPVAAAGDGRTAGGTIHLSAADRHGTLVALTLTHGESFGAQVTVEGLGLILGHGMLRFDPHPEHPNAPGPGKRPLHNMCPTVVYRDGRAVLAVGGRGGRRIPNSIFDVLTAYVARSATAAAAVAAPRLHTEGDVRLLLNGRWRDADVARLRDVGYNVQQGPTAVVHAVAFDPRTGHSHAAAR